MRLAVELHGVVVGRIDGDARSFDFTAWGMRRAAPIIDGTIDQLRELVNAEIPLEGAHEGLQAEISELVDNLR